MDRAQPQGKFRLLVVWSGDRQRRLIEQAAEETGLFWSVRSMADGRFALEHVWTCLERAPKDVPDIVITDVSVAGLNGIQLTRELRRYDEIRDLFVAILASNPSPTDQDAAETAGCDFYIRLPDSPEMLKAALKSIASRCHAKGSAPARMVC